ncbi:hypothetical protein [Halorhodospira halophila]|uniref:hypothetical protein n=1 Tax=Halorhodospira halophila TaxID=1053 RepID=UPI00191485D0|nr:hypothetical protein [Halorhodospira halophila]MBK5944828.1 hypothetical protein [Halorhodospira halophila]
MRVDVMGLNPVSAQGACFSRDMWRWHPLWAAVAALANNAGRVQRPHTDDGDGLDATHSRALAQELDEALVCGEADKFIRVVRGQCRAAGLPEVISLEDLREFRDFLRDCGGFSIRCPDHERHALARRRLSLV